MIEITYWKTQKDRDFSSKQEQRSRSPLECVWHKTLQAWRATRKEHTCEVAWRSTAKRSGKMPNKVAAQPLCLPLFSFSNYLLIQITCNLVTIQDLKILNIIFTNHHYFTTSPKNSEKRLKKKDKWKHQAQQQNTVNVYPLHKVCIKHSSNLSLCITIDYI